MSRILFTHNNLIISFPRVSGDEPLIMCVVRHMLVFSPREWG